MQIHNHIMWHRFLFYSSYHAYECYFSYVLDYETILLQETTAIASKESNDSVIETSEADVVAVAEVSLKDL